MKKAVTGLFEGEGEAALSGKLAALGAMAAGVAHEINTPLATIKGNVEILSMKLEEIPHCAEELLAIDLQVERIQRIVKNLLTFARVEPPRPEPTDARGALVEVLRALGPRAVERKVEVRTELPDYIPPVMAGYDQLFQIFNNLCTNALQAMARGGVLAIGAKVDEAAGEVELTFADSGEGIAPQDVDRIFNPFFSTKPSGTGLGLSISHSLVEGYGGRLLLETRYGEGTTFTVVLKIAE